MNKNIKLAVAGAVLALSASAANAGIIIPAGDWTLDISGNVNAYVTETKLSGAAVSRGHGNLWTGTGSADALVGRSANRTQSNITTGLLPNFLSVAGTTRQNDLDVTFLISINPGASTTGAGAQGNALNWPNQENRQAYFTVGDKSFGTFKLGKDLGIFASSAILNDMTLLGVGSGAGGLAGNTTTTGRIGTGFIYADWKSQLSYTSPNFNGFQVRAGMLQGFNSTAIAGAGDVNAVAEALVAGSRGRAGSGFSYEGEASYSWAANDTSGKVWVGGRSQRYTGIVAANANDTTSTAGEIGATVNLAGFGLTGYYYDGEGLGQTLQGQGAFDATGRMRDSHGGYVQATYVLPTKTKLGVSYGSSTLEKTVLAGDLGTTAANARDIEDSMWAVGAYHPLTKHLNLVAEYSDVESKQSQGTGKGRTVSVGGILFF